MVSTDKMANLMAYPIKIYMLTIGHLSFCFFSCGSWIVNGSQSRMSYGLYEMKRMTYTRLYRDTTQERRRYICRYKQHLCIYVPIGIEYDGRVLHMEWSM